ncbi:MAG: HAD family hydrolase [Candidatus Thorarchaeota archaeon]|nr:HAD family hydrolase [Candidatus Thorarchaeota archaeon]
MLKALVFDMDGTITELTLPLDDMREDTKNYYIKHGFPAELLEPADGISSSTAKAKDYFLSNGVQLSDWEQMEAEVDQILSQHEGFAAASAVLIEGTLDIVNRIRQAGMLTAILTNNGRSSVDKIMQQLPIANHFDIIQTRHESPLPKPYPDGLLKIALQLGVNVDEMVYVGDALIDAAAANRAGIEFWGVATGETPADVLQNAGASIVFQSLEGVLREVLVRSKVH